MNNSNNKVVCYGEVLWDVFPNHKSIGGAPLNVALRTHSFGADAAIISRVGNDLNGKEVLSYIKENGLSNDSIQIDSDFQTGAVDVLLDEKGSASYTIKHPVAWDKIQLTKEAIAAVKTSNAFVFGSLACRDDASRNTLLELLDYAKFKVFDVNLRPPHYSIHFLIQLMNKADFIKCNDEELSELCNHIDQNASTLRDKVHRLADYTNTRHLCVTLGAKGAVLLYDGKYIEQKAYKINVLDTVGAGDSFLATLLVKLLTGNDSKNALKYANAVGSLVATKKGANPKVTIHEINQLISLV